MLGDNPAAEWAAYHAAPLHQPPFVSFIRLFYSVVRFPTTLSAAVIDLCQIVRPIHARALAYATREGVKRRALMRLPKPAWLRRPPNGTKGSLALCPPGASTAHQPDSVKVGRGTEPSGDTRAPSGALAT